jgi:hypothetical protein
LLNQGHSELTQTFLFPEIMHSDESRIMTIIWCLDSCYSIRISPTIASLCHWCKCGHVNTTMKRVWTSQTPLTALWKLSTFPKVLWTTLWKPLFYIKGWFRVAPGHPHLGLLLVPMWKKFPITNHIKQTQKKKNSKSNGQKNSKSKESSLCGRKNILLDSWKSTPEQLFPDPWLVEPSTSWGYSHGQRNLEHHFPEATASKYSQSTSS